MCTCNISKWNCCRDHKNHSAGINKITKNVTNCDVVIKLLQMVTGYWLTEFGGRFLRIANWDYFALCAFGSCYTRCIYI